MLSQDISKIVISCVAKPKRNFRYALSKRDLVSISLLSVYHKLTTRANGQGQPNHTPSKAHLAATDRLIDQVVYRLYGLTEDEIALVTGRPLYDYAVWYTHGGQGWLVRGV